MPESEDRSWIQQDAAAFKLAALDVLRIARQTGTPLIIGDQDGNGFRAISPEEYLIELTLRQVACPQAGPMVEDIAPKNGISDR